MKTGSISLRSHVAWVPKEVFDSGFNGVVHYLQIGKIVVLCHPSATRDDLFKSLLACAKEIKSEGGGIVG